MGSTVRHPRFLITLTGPGSGAGDGVPGAAVREAATGRIVDLVPGQMDVYSAVAGTGDNRLFYLATRAARAQLAERDPEIGRVPPGGAVRVRIDDAGRVVELSSVPGIPEPEAGSHGLNDLAATADGGTLAYPVVPPRNWRPPAPPVWPVRDFHKDDPDQPDLVLPPAAVTIVTVATGERMVWQAPAGGFAESLSLSADGRRMAFSWHGRPEDTGIHVVDLPEFRAGEVISAPSRLVVPDRNTGSESPMGQLGLGCLGRAAISADGTRLYVAAARGEGGGDSVTRLVEVEVADGRVVRVAYEHPFRDAGNIVHGWGPMSIDPSGRHALIGYTGHLGRIDLGTGRFTAMAIAEHGAHSVAW